MAQPSSDRASANPTDAALAAAATVRVTHVAVHLGGDGMTSTADHTPRAAHDQKDKRKDAQGAGGGEAFASDVILVTSEDLRSFDGADDDESSGRVHLPAIEFS